MFQAHKRMMEAREKVAKREMKQSNKLFQVCLFAGINKRRIF
jgi:hypothetical protein